MPAGRLIAKGTAAVTSVIAFQQKWRAAKGLTERSAYQQHFLDLCALFGVPGPAEADPTGTTYAFEKGATKSTSGKGFADVWRRGFFAVEYKGAHANLTAAYNQLLQYSDALENPPILITCDLDRFEIHSRFTNTPTVTWAFDLDGLSESANLDTLRNVFLAPDRLRPQTSTAAVTEEAARRFGALAQSLTGRGYSPERVAHFLVQLLFCLFSEDAGLLPRGLFTQLLGFTTKQPTEFPGQVAALLTAMRDGGAVAYQSIDRFNGGLFAHVDPLPLTGPEIAGLLDASRLDWGAIEPAIFGTLFERGLDPGQRAALGAHYTGRSDIERVIDPVVVVPLRRRWADVRGEADVLRQAWLAAEAAVPVTAEARTAVGPRAVTAARTRRDRAQSAFAARLTAFQDELAAVRVLDPACGSGNFLYVALSRLMGLEKEVITYAATNGIPAPFPTVLPHQVLGIEINRYARELAQVVVWIGFLQWRLSNGFGHPRDPILDPLETIEHRDALLTHDADGTVREAEWPKADFIIGNPPFLGGNRIRSELGDAYVDKLFSVYDKRIPQFSDFVCYWFEKAREQIASGETQRAGLLSTNSIRGGVNRRVLERIKLSGDIFMAWDDEPWVLNGAAVRISIVGFDDGSEVDRQLDGTPVININADLSGTIDVTKAMRLIENRDIAFYGSQQKASFDIPEEVAERLLSQPSSFGKRFVDVIRPSLNGRQLMRGRGYGWVIDFGAETSIDEAMLYEDVFEYVRTTIYPGRANHNELRQREKWWLHARPSPRYRHILGSQDRYIVTSAVASTRVFAWLSSSVLADHALIVFARDDDYFFGVLHSRAHEVWSLRMGTSLEDRPRYTPTTCFETFPLPWAPGHEPTDDVHYSAISDAARRLDEFRRNWLNPPDIAEAELKKRTLTNLYNRRPTWLTNAHAALDRAVWAAYSWPADEVPAEAPEDTILARLLALNGERSTRTVE